VIEWDDNNKIIKYNPLLHWDTQPSGNTSIRTKFPTTRLHDKGFVSIGARPAPGRSGPVRISAPEDGGGRIIVKKNAACMLHAPGQPAKNKKEP
jgi:3'-phosphoadenosine 5'-phosphosulfate sulfotransferase (PAPS reductase)/FAD synthetase